jgi:HAE1 family hydrophobic/amphiphilic exporter-1
MWGQKCWWIVVPATIALFIWAGWIYDSKVIKAGFWRLPDIEQLVVYMEMPAGTDVTLTSETMMLFEKAILPVPDGARMRSQTWGNQAFLRVEFDKKALRSEIPMYFRQLLTEQADKLGGMSIFISGFSETPYVKGSFGGSTLNSMIKITGYNSRRLEEIAERTLSEIERNRRVRNARITTGSQFERVFQDEVVVTIDRERAARYGLSILDVLRHLRRLLGVDTPATMVIDDEEKRVQLAYYDSEAIQLADAEQTMLRTATGNTVRLGELIHVALRPLSGTITREDQRYTAYLNWEYVGTDPMRVAFIKRVLDSLDLPYGFHAEEGQREFYTPEEEEELTLAVILSVFFIFMVLAALFESIAVPFLVLLAVPMSLAGVFVAFWLTRSPFDSSARIGLILLFGVAVNNAILLADRFRIETTRVLESRFGKNREWSRSLFPVFGTQPGGIDLWRLPRHERPELLRVSVARAARIRLRSILLTSGTTIVGLAPLLVHFRQTDDKDIWENLALASIGGLTSSTILLVATIPAIYYVSVRFVGWPWRDAWGRADKLGRTLMTSAAVQMIALVSIVCAALYVAHVDYKAVESGPAVLLRADHRQIAEISGAVVAAAIALWAAAIAARRKWWHGLIALIASVLIVGIAFSAMNLLRLPFIKMPLGLLWIERDGIFVVTAWVTGTAAMRVLRGFISRRSRDTRDLLENGTPAP